MARKVWRILSIDGGGTRGTIPAVILASIEDRTKKPICELFDLIAGTSTGGILALGLTCPDAQGKPQFSAAHMCEVYAENIPIIFENPRSWWANLLGPKFTSFAFQKSLEKHFGDCRLKGALTDVVIPCYDIENRLPYIFRSRLAKISPEHDFKMRDVALAASASPTLFHPVSFPNTVDGRKLSLVDGGVFANNPALIGLSEMKSRYAREDDAYFVLSLGTGKLSGHLSDELISLWGFIQWSRPMLELVMESNSEAAHEQIQHLLPQLEPRHYYRLQVAMPISASPAIDDASYGNMKTLTQAANAFCSDGSSGREFDEVCARLLELSSPG